MVVGGWVEGAEEGRAGKRSASGSARRPAFPLGAMGAPEGGEDCGRKEPVFCGPGQRWRGDGAGWVFRP